MTDYRRSRLKMVRENLIRRGITDDPVLNAFRSVPRERFVWGPDRSKAYADQALRIACGQTISQPYMVAIMLQHLSVGPGEKVLEIGTGSGYQTALLSALGARVFSVERIPELAESAIRRLAELGYRGIHIFQADGTLGLPDEAPFDAVIVSAGAPEFPEILAGQLAEGGRLVAPVGGRSEQELIIAVRRDGKIIRRRGEGCRFIKLIGREGWSEE